ncbi:hypothetical protein [Psychrobacter sp. I-STPA10]|uniref:hypothetical protein n=1 Tax=Psychrobacter sp. I-STPA10 TaxID=2585769 RepID=UPI001E350911|nr:hypothetical protein [Psychrobacter sp. I-STPA10]
MKNKKIDWFFLSLITVMMVIVGYLFFENILLAIIFGLAVGAGNAWFFSKKSDKDNKSEKDG